MKIINKYILVKSFISNHSILFIILFCSCNQQKGHENEQILSLSKENQIELKKVLSHYQPDSLKHNATVFLVTNMPYHFSQNEYFVSMVGKTYVPEITHFKDKEMVAKHCDTLMRKGYNIKRELIYDNRVLNADYLIHAIDLAFEAWQKPWAKDVSFEDFCRYILPYRAQNEPISNLRETFMKRYMPLLDSAKAKNPMEACMIINAQLKKEIRYQETGSPLYPTIEEMDRSGIGTCEALCNYTTLVMRAVGIPVAVHQTTWSKMDMGHYWCAVLHEGKFYDLDPAGEQPDVYMHKLRTSRFLKPAKVYRRRFDPVFSSSKVKDDGYITYLKNPLLEDVTNEGACQVTDIHIKIDKAASKNNQEVYLCTYNHYQWAPIALGHREKDSCLFRNVVGNNIFIIAEAVGEKELKYITAPFLLDSIGNIRKFIPDMSTTVIQKLWMKEGEAPRILEFWDTDKDCFIPIASDRILADSTQLYSQIPDNALLWYHTPHRAMGQRVGFLQNGELKRTCDF